MPTEQDRPPTKTRIRTDRDAIAARGAADSYEDLQQASRKGSLFGKFNAAFLDVLHTSRGEDRVRNVVVEAGNEAQINVDDLAMRRARTVRGQRMILPEGVIIEGSITSASEAEIAGRIDGNVMVDGRLYLTPSALVSGNVRSASCKLEGLVEGNVDCSQELELGKSGRLNAEVRAAKAMTIAGQVFGNITCGGLVRLVTTAQVTGDIRARLIVIEEGAMFNGRCSMMTPAPRPAK